MAKSKSKYIDAFVLIVPKKKVAAYQKLAQDAQKLWMKHGALAYRECIGDDLKPEMPGCTFMTFPELTKLKSSETVWFSYIEYKSKTHRDSVNKKVMKEMHLKMEKDPNYMKDIPFDMSRFSFGGFQISVGS